MQGKKRCPMKHFTVLELLNPSNGVSESDKVDASPDFEALEL